MARVPTSRMSRPLRQPAPIPASLSRSQAAQERAHWQENWNNRKRGGRDNTFYEFLDGSVTHLQALRPFDPVAPTDSFSLFLDLEIANNAGLQTVFEFQNVNPFRLQITDGLVRWTYRSTTGSTTKTGLVQIFSNGARRWIEFRFDALLNVMFLFDNETNELIESLDFAPAIPALPWVGTNFTLDLGLRTNGTAPLLNAKMYSFEFRQNDGSPLLKYDLPNFDDLAGINPTASTVLVEV